MTQSGYEKILESILIKSSLLNELIQLRRPTAAKSKFHSNSAPDIHCAHATYKWFERMECAPRNRASKPFGPVRDAPRADHTHGLSASLAHTINVNGAQLLICVRRGPHCPNSGLYANAAPSGGRGTFHHAQTLSPPFPRLSCGYSRVWNFRVFVCICERARAEEMLIRCVCVSAAKRGWEARAVVEIGERRELPPREKKVEK